MTKFLNKVYSLMMTLLIIGGMAVVGLYVCGIRPYVVQTGSMSPAIEAGSICFVNHRSEFSEVQVGDIIAFRLGVSTIVTHRAVRLDMYGIVTKGDANHMTDANLVTEENFVGKTVFWIPEIGNQIKKLHTTKGKIHFVIFVFLLTLPAFLLDDKNQKP